MAQARDFNPREILEALERNGVWYVLIGAFAARLHGSPLRTDDADICPARDRENMERLSRALHELDARLRGPGVPEHLPWKPDARSLASAEIWTLRTRAGNLDIAFRPAGTGGYEDLASRALVYDVGGVRAPVAALEDIIRSKDAAGRDKDRAALPTLRDLLGRVLEAEGEPGPREEAREHRQRIADRERGEPNYRAPDR